MGNKDYEVLNRDYSSYEYHHRGDDSYGYSNNSYRNVCSSGNNSLIINIFVLFICFIGVSSYMYLNFETTPDVEKTTNNNISKSNKTTKPNVKKNIGLLSQNNDNSMFKNNNTLDAHTENEEKNRINILENRKNSSTSNQKSDFKKETSDMNKSDTHKEKYVESARKLTPWEEFREKNKEAYDEISKFEKEFSRKRFDKNMEKMDESQLIKEFYDFNSFYDKFGNITKEREFFYISRRSSILGFFARVAMNNDYPILFKILIDNGFKPKNWSFNDLPVIFYAAERDCRSCLDILLKMDMDLKQELTASKNYFPNVKHEEKVRIEEGKTLLHVAAKTGNISLAKLCLDAGVLIDKKTNNQKLPITYAVENNQFEMVDFLVKRGAKLTDDLKNLTNDERILDLIANYNKSSEVANSNKNTEVSNANDENLSASKDDEWFEAYNYIKNGELINFYNLSKAGKDFSKMYYKNETAPCIAVSFNQFEILKFLLHEYNCENLVNKINKQNALHYAVNNENSNMVTVLLLNGFFPNQSDIEGNTPLHYAVGKSSTTIVESLIMKGANPNLLNNKKQNALHLAVLSDNVDFVKYLLNRGANINQQDIDGNTPLHYLAMFSSNNIPMLDSFYKYSEKLDFTIKNKEGKTPRNMWETDCFDNYEKKFRSAK